MKQNADRSVLDLDRLIEAYEEDLDGMPELFDLMLKNNPGCSPNWNTRHKSATSKECVRPHTP